MSQSVNKYKILNECPLNIKETWRVTSIEKTQFEGNKSVEELFSYFSIFVKTKGQEYVNAQTLLEPYKDNLGDWELELPEDTTLGFTLISKNNPEIVHTFTEKDIREHAFTLQEEYLSVLQLKGFSDQISSKFLDEFYGREWESKKVFITNNTLLNEAKKYFEAGSDILNWSLEPDEFVAIYV